MKYLLIPTLLLFLLPTFASAQAVQCYLPSGATPMMSSASDCQTAGGSLTPGTSLGGNGAANNGTSLGGNTGTNGGLFNPLGAGTSLETFLHDILAFVVRIGTVVVVLMLVYVGFMFATAQGDPGKISTAREALLWTVVGALILLGAQAIASGIQATANSLSTSP